MAMAHSPRRTRAQTPATSDAESLRAVLQELQQLREERQQDQREQQQIQKELRAQLEERDSALKRLEERLNKQMSPSNNNISASANESRNVAMHIGLNNTGMNVEGERVFAGLKVKSDTYDGTVSLREFLVQFSLISQANGWNDSAKAVALASCLRGKARTVLNTDNLEKITFEEIKAKLELQFGESELMQNYYSQFTNRKILAGEDFATLGADLERLSRGAYPECSFVVRDKIACAQFIAAMSDNFIKRSLLTEGIVSLKAAIERAKILQSINENCFSQRFVEQGVTGVFHHSGKNENKKRIEFGGGRVQRNFRTSENKGRECWQCGGAGHFRSECPTLQQKEN